MNILNKVISISKKTTNKCLVYLDNDKYNEPLTYKEFEGELYMKDLEELELKIQYVQKQYNKTLRYLEFCYEQLNDKDICIVDEYDYKALIQKYTERKNSLREQLDIMKMRYKKEFAMVYLSLKVIFIKITVNYNNQ